MELFLTAQLSWDAQIREKMMECLRAFSRRTTSVNPTEAA
jgi:hypothetical protein